MDLPKTAKLKAKISQISQKDYEQLTLESVKDARGYIKNYWPKLVRQNTKDEDTLIGLPHKYLVPAFERGHEFDFNELYYWDSYFMVQGIMDERHRELVLGILENLLSLFERFKIIPNASRTYLMGRSQPPILTSFIMDVYKAYKLDKKWLARAITIAEAEYNTVWMGTTKPNARQVYEGLSRYYDVNYLNDLAEAESGWDMTPRFSRKCLNYLPVDLNCLLYKYERDFAYARRLLGQETEAVAWEKAAHERRIAINQLMWSEVRGLYYDYDYVKRRRGSVDSLAAYYSLWAGVASEKQAARLVRSLKRFEHKGGLSTTNAMPLNQFVPGGMPMQWAYPNGWAPLHFIAVAGLLKYGYGKEARRIALKWLSTNLKWFNKHGVFLEKYNVVQPDKPPLKGVYPSQTGFGWTNSVFEYFCQQFLDKV
ncbi:MAG TPA: trehalase family glycosidase [Candidatus Binatia bacterium]|nr:trehalase family glycosidase [Candidatus Binatia bacterium]